MAKTSLPVLDAAFVPDERKGELLRRLRRAKGQIAGIERMLESNRPCMEVLTQLAAASEAIRGASRVMARNYLERCAPKAIAAGREQEVYDELLELVFKLAR